MRSLVCLSMIFLFASRETRTQRQPRIVPHPEALAGRWETSDGRGGAIGMNIMLSTRIEGSPKTIDDQSQFEDNFTVGLYKRTGTDVEQFNFFTTSADGGAVWNGHHLTIHLPPKADLPLVNVDLIWHDELHEWTGLLERGTLGGQVTLKRPAFDGPGSPFIGTWLDSAGPMNSCIHIVRQSGGGFTAWSDDIQIPGRMVYANGIQPPAYTIERYGNIAKVKVEAPDQITIELQAYTAGCCPRPFSAKTSADKKTLLGNWPPGQWKKMTGNSCIGKTTP